MDQAEKEIARRALQTALERLGSPADAGRDSSGDDGTIVLIMLASASSPMAESIKANGASTDYETRLGRGYEQGVAHPGFEKFSLSEGDPKASAPKPCFIEPDRVCVNSGACEMRGY
jgi:hypothetical protein